jgi:hypothetical protein
MGKRYVKRNMAETKKELMFDPQWLDMNYEKYYFVPWPDCQVYEDIDDDDPDVVRVEGGAFVSMRWLFEDEEENDYGPEYN